MSHTTINRVSDASLGFISNSDDGLTAITSRDMKEQFRNITGAKHLMNGGEPGGALIGAEVGSKYAIGCALSP